MQRVLPRLLALLTWLAVPGLPRAATPAAERINVVFILADDLGWAELGSYGQKKIQTPPIDSLARDGMKFHHAYAGGASCCLTQQAGQQQQQQQTRLRTRTRTRPRVMQQLWARCRPPTGRGGGAPRATSRPRSARR